MDTTGTNNFWSSRRRIAVVGMTFRQDELAYLIYQHLRTSGHQAYAVSPDVERTATGDHVYPDVKLLPQRPDGVMIVCPPEAADKVVHDCAEAMIQQVWIHPWRSKSIRDFTDVLTYCQQHKIEVVTDEMHDIAIEQDDYRDLAVV